MYKRVVLGALAAGMLAFAAPAHAALVTVVEIDLTEGGTAPFQLGPSFDFDIPGFSADLHVNAGVYALGDTYAAYVSKSGVGSGVVTQIGGIPIDESPELDNGGLLNAQEFMNFTIPGAPGFQFTLVGVELSFVDWDENRTCPVQTWKCILGIADWDYEVEPGDDDFSVIVDDELPPIITSDVIGGTDCGQGSGGVEPGDRCRIGLADGLLDYINGANPAGIDPFDWYLNMDPSSLFGSKFTFAGAIGGYDDDYKITKIYWEVSTASVPEPTTLSLFGLGLLGAGLAARRRRVAG